MAPCSRNRCATKLRYTPKSLPCFRELLCCVKVFRCLQSFTTPLTGSWGTDLVLVFPGHNQLSPSQ